MGQLTSQGITWKYTSRNGKVAFTHGEAHVVVFNPATKSYLLKEDGKVLVDCKSPVSCLALATDFIRDYHASKFIPAWEDCGKTGCDNCGVPQGHVCDYGKFYSNQELRSAQV